MKHAPIFLLRAYRFFFSVDRGLLARLGLKSGSGHCVFYPSCSWYALQCFEKYHFPRALGRSLKRVCRCHPWQTPRVDEP